MDRTAADRFRELIGAAKGGDESAFGELYQEWYAPVYRFVMLRVKDKEVAEDLTQDVFLKVYNHLDRFEMRAAHPLGFLYTTARNTIIDFRKKRKTERLDEMDMPDIPDTNMRTPQEDASASWDVGHLKEAMEVLTDEQQSVITLRLIEEKPVREAAEILGKSEEAVRQLQVRALRALRAYFAEHHYLT
jgi:RNA polymerase sigma-70 factor (ECF subfamily)